MNLVKLYVYRDWNSEHNGAWRLMFGAADAATYTNAEGECSAKLFRTMREAVAHGQRRYSETATKWRGIGFPLL